MSTKVRKSDLFSQPRGGRSSQSAAGKTATHADLHVHSGQECLINKEEAYRASLDFWRRELSGELPVLDLPLDHLRGPGRPSCACEELRFSLPTDLKLQLEHLAEKEGVPLSSVYLSAYAILLSRYGNTPDVLVGHSATTRSNSGKGTAAGGFRNLAIVRAHCMPDLSFRELLHNISDTVTRAQQHQHIPFLLLMQALSVTAPAGRAGLCDANFIWEDIGEQNMPPNSAQALDVRTPPVDGPFDVVLKLQSCNHSLKPFFLYRKDLFEASTMERMSRHWIQLLQGIVSSSETPISRIDMMPHDERSLVLGHYAGGSADYPRVCLHQLFAEHAAAHPDAESLVFGTKRLTYKQLDQQSNRIAHFLRNQGICHEDRIGIFMDRSADMIVSMLGILKAGGAYVPIDPDYPAERLKFIVEDTMVRLVLTERRVHTPLPTTAPLIYVDGSDSPIRACSQEPVANISTPESIAAVIYTSGSTGQPKGVCIPHRAAVRTVCNTNHVDATRQDRIAQVGSPSFDAAILEIWLALANGATLIGMRRETLLDFAELINLLGNERITILVVNTAYVHQIGREAPDVLKGIRKVLFGGEAAEPEPLRNLLKHVGPGVLVNGYGPAEGCVISTYYEINSVPEDAITVPIGRPVTNAQVYLLDSHMQPAPIGVQGEIYIGGSGVARGYWNRPEVTAQRFIPDPFSGKPGGLLYRTGDLARMRGDGEFEFLGRIDEQVKIRGHRIELAEVRQAIASHPDVKQIYLWVREDQPGDKRLVAYITLHSVLASESLRRHVKSKLPSYMLPAAFVVVDSIPLNTNGKADRRALPPPNERPDLTSDFQAPQTGLERLLTGIWLELLRIDTIGVNDNFFDLGGHSLLAARLIARIEKETGHNVPIATLFEAPTIAQLANKLTQSTYASAWSPLVELHVPKEDTPLAPLFCVHSLEANLVNFHKIASLLRGDRPIYGLQPYGLDNQHEPLESIEMMASAYLDEIRKKQLHGPYYLAGICIGGVLAYEIAQQLRAAGEEVACLIFIDSFLFGDLQHQHARSNLTEYLDWHLGEILLLGGIARLKYFANWAANGAMRLARVLRRQEDGSLARATRRVTEATKRAALAYEPKPYAGKISQFMCSDEPHRSYEDRRLAWSALAAGGLEIQIVPGNHRTMVEEPHVRVLAEQLQVCLDRISGIANAHYRKTDKERVPQSAVAKRIGIGRRETLHSGEFSSRSSLST